VIAGIVALAVWGARQIYFLGTDEGGRLALYRGLPYDLPLDVKLYSEVRSTPVQVASLSVSDQETATEHELRSQDDAESLLADLEAKAGPPTSPGGGGGGGSEQPGAGNQARPGDGGDRQPGG
jgi:hypothetical protein